MITQHEAFRLLERMLGFRPEPTRADDVTRALAERLAARGCKDASAYGRVLDDLRLRAEETRIIADRLTVNETYFLRESAGLRVLVERLIPELLARGSSPVRVLSVGCSTGEEPYGLGLLLHEAGIGRGQVEIRGIDVSPNAIASARRAQYSEWALRNVPAALRARYFERERKGYRLLPELRERVRFELGNVVDEDGAFWDSAEFDVILCRNLLIYLGTEAIEFTISRFARALAPGGTLFLGHAETSLAGPRFSVEEADGAFYFRLRKHPAGPSRRVRPSFDADQAAQALLEPIGRAGSRVQELAARLSVAGERPPSERVEELGDVLELIQQERFDDALQRVEASQLDERSERALLRAVLLTNLGRTTEASQLAQARLARLPSCPFAHYLLGVCHETACEHDEARRLYARSAELDPGFAMPRLRAGMLARRAGRPEEARRALEGALEQFPYQAARTQLLYGGGFAREELASLCRSELRSLRAAAGERA
ncbi:MAG TPA: CheR family methyltransferase [Polyangiaceae bacterium]|nr:CheR family methyltransferase [Polyangiaceae bacterium]